MMMHYDEIKRPTASLGSDGHPQKFIQHQRDVYSQIISGLQGVSAPLLPLQKR